MTTSTTTAATSAAPLDDASGSAGWSRTDETFFRLVGELFPPALLWGASVLLASYDPAGDQPHRAVETPA